MIKLKHKINFNSVFAHLHVETYEIHNKNNVINYFSLKIQLHSIYYQIWIYNLKFQLYIFYITINFN